MTAYDGLDGESLCVGREGVVTLDLWLAAAQGAKKQGLPDVHPAEAYVVGIIVAGRAFIHFCHKLSNIMQGCMGTVHHAWA